MQNVNVFLIMALASVSIAADTWYCGSKNDRLGGASLAFAEVVVDTNCNSQKESVNLCCKAHDNCYNSQGGKKTCDENFCSCLEQAANSEICKDTGSAMCLAVKLFGENAYKKAGQ
ncbi:unnamed protein product [Bursaphelenchus xylophilus]|uniref:(pine wood nematode) hypothetical protein n=1 Tax=Bursaphelenchus xylophilus TaxID=6326 RepID=A0A1I7S0Z5_BURXY|nr:unnamed protein product [Bursaphelenchus xylophilus]CAG9087923.1 unnamed protein product [Bursaphelenchus xylophilus]